MLRSWRVANFKAIKRRADLAFGQLTVITGSNSSGKSSLLQSILLVSQSLASPLDESPLLLNGPLLRVGALKNTFFQGSHVRRLSFRIEASADPERFRRESTQRPRRRTGDLMAVLTVELRLPRSATEPFVERVVLESTTEAGRTELSARRAEPKTLPLRIGLQSTAFRRAAGTPQAFDIDLTLPQRGLDSYPSARLSGDSRANVHAVGLGLTRFVPNSLVYEQDLGVLAVERAIRILREPEIDTVGPYPDSFELADGVASVVMDAIPRRGRVARRKTLAWFAKRAAAASLETRRQLAERLELILIDDLVLAKSGRLRVSMPTQLPPDLERAAAVITDVLVDDLHYLGPLREDPKAYYDLPASSRRGEVGLKGQYATAQLYRYRNTRVQYWDSETASLRSQSFAGALDTWLRRLDLLTSAVASEAGQLGHQLFLTPRGLKTAVDPTFVGVGVSQVLPVLMQGLLAMRGTTVILEQPELHLHPDVQAELADFLLSLTQAGVQIIVETHSEHLINRLRVRVGQGEVQPDHVAIYFVTRADKIGTKVERLDLTESGTLVRWPAGFFDRASADADQLLKANLMRQAKKPGAVVERATERESRA